MNEQIDIYLQLLLRRIRLPVPPYTYITRYAPHVETNDWDARAHSFDEELGLFVGAAELCHGKLSMPWGSHDVYVNIYAIRDGDMTVKSMIEATLRSCMLWDYATSRPINEVLQNKKVQYHLDNENLFLDMTSKYYKLN